MTSWFLLITHIVQNDQIGVLGRLGAIGSGVLLDVRRVIAASGQAPIIEAI